MRVVAIGESNLTIADGNYSAKYPRSEEFLPEGIPFIRGNNFENKSISEKDMYFISPEKHSELKKGHVKPKDVLITTRGNIGKVALVPEKHNDSNINAQIVLLRCNEGWLPEYLLHTFNSKFVKRQIPALITGSALKQLSVKNLKKIQIPLPPLDQQKKISAILDAADAYRQKTKALIEKYDELTQSLFLDMFGDPVTNPKGWVKKELSKLGNIVTGSTPPSSKEGMFGGDIPFVTPGDLEHDRPVKRTVTREGAENSRVVRKGSLFLCCIGATIGKKGIAGTDSSFNQQINAVEWNELINDRWGLYAFTWLKHEVIERAISTTLPIMKKSEFEKVKAPCPPIQLQNQFAEKVQVIEAQKAQAEASLAQAEDLFNSLLQRAFNGELTS